MEGRTLKRLAEVGEMSKLDLSPGAVTLSPIDGGVLSWYSGVSAAGGVEAQVSDGLSRPVSVYSSEFKEIAGLFDDDVDVKLKPDASELVLQAGTRRVALRYLEKPDTSVYTQIRDHLASTITVDRDEFYREMQYAAQVTAVTMTTPVLTGIRITANKSAMGFQAMNGSSLVFQAAIKAEASEEFQIVAPTNDMLTALRLLDSEIIGIHQTGRSIVIQGTGGVVKLSTLDPKPWPTNAVTKLRELEFTESVTIPAASIRAIAAAVRAYKATNDVVIRPSQAAGKALLETRASEMGQFQEVISASLSKPYVFDVADLETASRMAADKLTLEFSPNMALAKNGMRKLYVLCRVDK